MNKNIKKSQLGIILTLFCLLLQSDVLMAETDKLFLSALKHYDNEDYDIAIVQLESALKEDPEVAKYHHILAVSYGREAERANWFKAMDYAKNTLAHLKLADELDPNNVDILDDLMDYYHKAPEFLGGDSIKADEIEALIKDLKKNNT